MQLTAAHPHSSESIRVHMLEASPHFGTRPLLTRHRSPFNDQINNSALWGPLYDGRAIVTTIHEQFLAGTTLQDLQKSLKDDYSTEESNKLINTWA